MHRRPFMIRVPISSAGQVLVPPIPLSIPRDTLLTPAPATCSPFAQLHGLPTGGLHSAIGVPEQRPLPPRHTHSHSTPQSKKSSRTNSIKPQALPGAYISQPSSHITCSSIAKELCTHTAMTRLPALPSVPVFSWVLHISLSILRKILYSPPLP